MWEIARTRCAQAVTSNQVHSFLLNSIPAYILRCLQFRSGEIESLTDRRFVFLNRLSPFWTSLLIGGNFWGCIFSGVFTGVLFGGTVFLFLWEESKAFALTLLAIGVGMSCHQYNAMFVRPSSSTNQFFWSSQCCSSHFLCDSSWCSLFI